MRSNSKNEVNVKNNEEDTYCEGKLRKFKGGQGIHGRGRTDEEGNLEFLIGK